jgi:Na+-driven multidrug efflux pump
VGPCYIIFALIFVSSGVVNGAGQTMIPMLVTLISLWAVRVPLALFLSQHTPLRTKGIWLAMAIGFVVTALVNYLYYVSGRWKKSAAKIQAPPVEEPISAAALEA